MMPNNTQNNETAEGWTWVRKTHRHTARVDTVGLYVRDGRIIDVSITKTGRPGQLVRYSKAISKYIAATGTRFEDAVENGALREEYAIRGTY